MKYTIYDMQNYIYLDRDGNLVFQSIFEKNFDGDIDLLLACCEDNMDKGRIFYEEARRDYISMLDEPRTAGGS